jgi:hypothetical protein
MGTFVIAAAVAVLTAFFFVAELRARPKRQGEALYLVSRAGARLGLELREKPLSLVVPWSRDEAVIHYHLLRTGGEKDSITLTARRGEKSRLGNLVVASEARLFTAGLDYLALGVAQLDRSFRIFAEADRRVLLTNLLEDSGELLALLQDLACRTPSGRFELMDIGGRLKIQVDDKSLRFPTDVERITLDLVRVYQLYSVLAGVRDVRDVPAAAAPVRP